VAPFEKKGFTLIEMIVALLIFGILSTLLFSTLIRIQRRTSTSQWKNELTEEGVRICNTIRLELTGARKILYADEDSISFFNQEGDLLSFYAKDSLLFKSKKRLTSAKTKLSSFKFIYYLPSDIIGESADPIYSLPLDATNLQKLTVIDWKIGLKKGITSVNLKTGIFTRNIR
jgi:prepilin-type N-terminal cleavage/methylation domain-containing protein